MLKKIIAFVAACLLGVSLVACASGSGEEKVAAFVSEPKPGITSELTYYYVGDSVKKQTVKNTLDFATLGVDKDAVLSNMKELAKQYQGVKGMKHELKVSDNSVVETATIDYANLDFDKAKKIAGVTFTGDSKEISFEASKKLLVSQGYKEKK